MRKKLRKVLMATAIGFMTAAGVNAQTPSTLFLNYFTGDKPSEANDLARANDGSFYALMQYQTNAQTGQGFTMNGDTIAGTPEITGTNSNRNLLLVKTDANGNRLWTLRSVTGYVDQRIGWNPGALIGATADGGCVIVAKMILTVNNADKNIAFIDGTGQRYELNDKQDSATAFRNYNIIILKVSPAGKIEWNKIVTLDKTPQPKASKANANGTSNGFTLGDMVVSENGDIYFGGRYAKAMTFTKADNSTVTLSPHNIPDTWNGAAWSGMTISSAFIGDLFIVRLDSKGNYLNSLTADGPAKVGILSGLSEKDGDIYASGLIIGKDSVLSVQGKTFKASTSEGLLSLRLNSDLSVKWLNYLNGAPGNGFSTELGCAKIKNVNDKVWLYGQIRGIIADEDGDSLKSYHADVKESITRFVEGYIIRLDPNTGKWINGITTKTDEKPIRLQTFGHLFDNPDDTTSIYIFGNAGTALSNLKAGYKGPFVRRYDVATLTPHEEYDLFTGGTLTQVREVSNGDSIYIITSMNGQTTIYDSTVVGIAKKTGILVSAFKVPFINVSTGIKAINQSMPTERKGDNRMYNLAGQRVDASYRGIVIMNGKKYLRK